MVGLNVLPTDAQTDVLCRSGRDAELTGKVSITLSCCVEGAHCEDLGHSQSGIPVPLASRQLWRARLTSIIDMRPCFAKARISRRFIADAKLFRDDIHVYLTIIKQSHFSDGIVGQFGPWDIFASAMRPMANLVGRVFNFGRPSEIVLAVVRNVAIPMRCIMVDWPRAVEGFTDQMVHVVTGSCTKLETEIARLWARSQKFPGYQGSYASKTGCGIVRVSWNREPSFFGHMAAYHGLEDTTIGGGHRV